MTTYVVGIAGPSCSGKSLIAERLAYIYSQHRPCLLCIDAYYHDLSELQPLEREQRNYDTPDAIDSELLRTQLTALLAGREIEKPVYDFRTHTRLPVTERIGPTNLILIEGLFVLYWEQVRRLLNTGIFVSLSPDLALSRRLQRDVNERGRNPESVMAQYESTVKPMNSRYVLPSAAHADIIINGAQPIAESIALAKRPIDAHFNAIGGMLARHEFD